MHNRRDQVQAHGFMVGRLVSALLRAEPDLARPPLRRSWLGLFIGSLLAALVVAGFAVTAVISPGGATAWRKPGTLILDKQTGARYVLAAGRLRPVLNYASARLLLGEKLTVDSVTSSSLKDVPRGTPVGIDGAPDALPKATGEHAPWLVCASSAPDASQARAALSLVIGEAADVRPLSERQAVVVRTTDGTTYLVNQGRRMRVTAPWVTRALGFSDDGALGVRDAWVNTLPAGPDLPQPAVTDRGKAGPKLDGRPTKLGEVFVVHGTGMAPHLYLLTPDGLQPLTQTGATLALSDPGTAKAYDGGTPAAQELSTAALASARVLPSPAWQTQLPAAPPTLGPLAGRMPCVSVVPGGSRVTPELVTVPAMPVTGVNTVSDAGGSAAGDADHVADHVEVAPGAGLLARSLPAPGVPGAGLYLITEDGTRFPVGSDDAAGALGYVVSSAVPVPAGLLALLPGGPVLDVFGRGGDNANP
ncbi:MAG: type VII secretion protein EccB [Actinoallomurus sp.]